MQSPGGTALLLATLFATLTAQAQPDYDILIRGGQLFDGTGAALVSGDIALSDGRIAAIGELNDATAGRTIDAAGYIVTPGFIDIHSHADDRSRGGGLGSPAIATRAAPNLVAQGITTVVVNQDGRSPTTIATQRAAYEANGIGPNAALLTGHNTIREAVLKSAYKRAATPEEIALMAEKLRADLQAGAVGISAGLEYSAGVYATTDELIALAQELVPYRGAFIIHERASGTEPMWYLPSRDAGREVPNLLDYTDELITLAEQSGATIVATHIKARGTSAWGSSAEMVARINAARGRGLPLFGDQYPYTTSGSDGAITLIPTWLWDDKESGPIAYAALLKKALGDPLFAEPVRKDIAQQIMRRGGPEHIYVMDYPDHTYIGKTLAELAAQRNESPVDVAIALQLEGDIGHAGGARLRGYSMSPDDVETFMQQPWVATATDAGITLPDSGKFVHARFYGAFPRKIAKYALKKELIALETALRSATGLPADIMAFDDRGYLRVGYAADLVLFDPSAISDTATFTEPHQYPEGIDYVFVNGVPVVDNGERTNALPGQVLVSKKREAPGP